MSYRFLAIEVDTARQVVSVEGNEVACQRRVYQLLVMLCRAGGGVVRREELFAELWDGQPIPSDESLTQLVHRLRATLGPSSRAIRTVRGVGFRLDCEVEAIADRETHESPAPAAAPGSGLPPPADALPQPLSPAASAGPREREPARRRAPVWAWVAAAALLPLLAAAAWLGLYRPWQVIDSGYGLRRGDLGSGHRQAIDLVSRALTAEGAGDRPQARHLLETANATDPSTPVPAALLSVLSPSQEQPDEARRWASAAERRLRPTSSPYLHLLVQFARARSTGAEGEWLAADSALLGLRPAAWLLRLARAHYHLAHREEAAALADLRQIPIPVLNARGLAIVLADRASLGDTAGAERDLALGLLQGQEALVWYVRGRIDRSRHRAPEALAAFDRELATAIRRNQPDLILDARFLGALAACEAGDLAGAASRFDLAAAEARTEQRPEVAADALGLGAYLAWRRGDPAGRDQRLAEAAALHAEPSWPYRLSLALLASWTGAKLPEDPRTLAAQVPRVPEVTGVGELLLARAAWAAGNREEAGRRLRQAREEGVEKTFFSEEEALLAADLGGLPQPQWVDPPYPNELRFAAAWEVDRRRGRLR